MNTHPSTTPLSRTLSVLVVLAGLANTVHAEDIDIYGGSSTGSSSNLVIVLDNAGASNGNTVVNCPTFPGTAPFQPIDGKKNMGHEVCGLYGGLASLKSILKNQQIADPSVTRLPLNLGLMYFPGGPTDGGQFVLPASRAGLSTTDLIALSDSGIDQFMNRVAKISTAADQGNNNQFSQALQESFAFYNAKKGLSGTQYGSPSETDLCAKNFVVYITLATNNQKPQDGGQKASSALTSLIGPVKELALPTEYTPPYPPAITYKAPKTTTYQSDPSDEWSKFMSTGMVNGIQKYAPVTVYTIILYDGSNPGYEVLMANVSRQSGSKVYYVPLDKPDGLAAAVESIARQVMAVNSVFAAPVLPVSANSQGTYDNQVFMGMFRPDGSGLPRWMGNLKQYKFGLDESNPQKPSLYLGGAELLPNSNQPKPVLSDAGTGFMDPSAISFWTSKDTSKLPDKTVDPNLSGGFWLYAVTKQEGKDGYDMPDGQIVEKGGVGQQIRLAGLTDLSKRNVYTCVGSGCKANAALSGMKFNTDNGNITSSALGAADASNRANIINWARGEDVAVTVPSSGAGPETSTPPDPSIKVRGSVHGDVLHSRPAVLNYKNHGLVVFYGANDGLFRAINGNQPNNPSDTSKPLGECSISATCAISTKDASGNTINVMPGGELWSFIPEEFYGGIKRIYDNTVSLTLGLPLSSTRQPKTYFFDGSPGVYQNGDTAWIFLSTRRGSGSTDGGRMLYALDVSDPTNPKLKWKINNNTTGFSELGQTWSQPKVAMVKGHTGPVLIFGAGYDPNQDNDLVTAADTMGRGIFIVDADTGKLLWSAEPGGSSTQCTGNPCKLSTMKYSIPADITLVDRIPDGDIGIKIDRLYAADTGGNLWRVDLEPDGTGDISTWQAYQIAALGGSGTPKRKFFFPPDIVMTAKFDAVATVSGDREHPMYASKATNVTNRFYMIKDTKVGPNGLDGTAWSVIRDDTSPTELFNATSTNYDGSLKGFYVTLQAGDGEKGVNAPIVLGGTTYFGTNRPIPLDSATCKPNLGEARGYQINFLTGEKKTYTYDGGGLPPSPTAGLVNIKDSKGKETVQPFITGSGPTNDDSCKSALCVGRPNIGIKKSMRRTYWIRNRDR